MTDKQRQRNALTPLAVGLILGLVALVVLCCLGWAALAVLAPAPG